MNEAPIFRHSAAWSIAVAAFGTTFVAWALGLAVADAPERTVAAVLIAAVALAVAGAVYGGWLVWRRRASVVASALGVVLNVVALVLALALALVLRW